MKINYISNLPLSEISGGFSGMNEVAHEAISEIAEINYVGPVSPPTYFLERLSSKARRKLGAKGNFFFFSERRLQQIAREVGEMTDPAADLDFYHGFTPWILCRSPRPYMAWSDCSFYDYIHIYHDSRQFNENDIQRICEQEALWMTGSGGIFLSSEWAKHRIFNQYRLSPQKIGSVGIFGAMEPPDEDRWDGGQDFYFISTDYKRKNGALCRQAMNILWETHPSARLRIIGAQPPLDDLVPGRVTYEGFFRKSNVDELRAFRAHLQHARALLHPTDADTTAMILIEAAFFGCPAISVKDFAIPEVLGEPSRDLLLDRPLTATAIAAAMRNLLGVKHSYQALRKDVRKYAISNHTVDNFKKRVQEKIQKHIQKYGKQCKRPECRL